MSEIREKEILSLSAGGRVSELQLRYRLQYQVYDRQKNLIAPPGEILARRDYSYNDQEQLSKESEEALLYRDMQNDAVQQLVRRLQAVPKAGAKPAAKAGDKG
jgi:LPS-assembly lipoprotein